ncbi:putative ATPase, V0 complex, subunit e1/e2 [Helianthus debilis subsp. tardiflorus]|nr:putative ATPase, V0 complex, subunit e1/e2 [Helianthus annuus]
MGFVVTTLTFIVIGIVACFCTRVCCNKGPSANLFHLTLVITATICCWMM